MALFLRERNYTKFCSKFYKIKNRSVLADRNHTNLYKYFKKNILFDLFRFVKFLAQRPKKEIDENLNKIDGNFCLKNPRRKAQKKINV